MVVLLWIAIAFVCGFAGKDRECGFGWAFFWGIICPIIGILYVAFSKRKKTPLEAMAELDAMYNNGLVDAVTYSKAKTDIQCGEIKPLSEYKEQPMSQEEQIIRYICISIILFFVLGYFIF